jgi:hypothetical protein
MVRSTMCLQLAKLLVVFRRAVQVPDEGTQINNVVFACKQQVYTASQHSAQTMLPSRHTLSECKVRFRSLLSTHRNYGGALSSISCAHVTGSVRTDLLNEAPQHCIH